VDFRFTALWKSFLFQSLLTGLAMAIVLLAFTMQEATIVTSLAATIFIVFMAPTSPAAQPRKVIGGHSIGLLCGSVMSFVPHTLPATKIAVFAVAVAIAAFLMALLNMEHPPGAGTALALAVDGFTVRIALAVLIGVVILALIHRLLRRWLKDLV
jgi:CBS-domain-containing membrane protein